MLETLCRQYLLARSAGTVRLLTAEEMRAAHERYRTYGQADVSFSRPGARDRQRDPTHSFLRLHQHGEITAALLMRRLDGVPHVIRIGDRSPLHVRDDIAWHKSEVACLAIGLDG